MHIFTPLFSVSYTLCKVIKPTKYFLLTYCNLIKVSICFLSSVGYFILKSAGVYLWNASFRCSGGCGCCCNPLDAEQNLSWDFTPSSPISSFPHFLVLSSPLHLSFHLISADSPERFPPFPLVSGRNELQLVGGQANHSNK